MFFHPGPHSLLAEPDEAFEGLDAFGPIDTGAGDSGTKHFDRFVIRAGIDGIGEPVLPAMRE